MSIGNGVNNKKALLTPQFIWKLAVLLQVLRIIGTLIVLIYPNWRNIHDLLGLKDTNDGQWYYSMAFDGFIQYLPGGAINDIFANFSTFLPILMSILGTIVPHYLTPFIINTLCTIPIPWLAGKIAVKIVPSGDDGPTEDQAWRQRLIVYGIALNPVLLGYSIYPLTEPLFYMFLLIVLNCNQRKGAVYVAGELIGLFFMGWTKFNTLIICAYYLYQLAVPSFFKKKFNQMLRPLACIALVMVNFVFWDFIFPVSIWGITASESMEKWWGVRMSFSPDSISFIPKIAIEAIGLFGVLTVFRLFSIRNKWGFFGWRDKYLNELRSTKRTPSGDGLDPTIYPEFDQAGKIGPINYEFVEALLFYGFCLFAFHGLFDPITSFFRYIAVILPFYACISLQNRVTNNAPAAIFVAFMVSLCSLLGIFIFLLSFSASGVLSGILPSAMLLTHAWEPDALIDVGLLVIVVVLFFKYYFHIKQSVPKSPDLRKIAIWLSVCAVSLMFVVLNMP